MLASFFKRLLRPRNAHTGPPTPGRPSSSNENWLNEALRLRELGRNAEMAALCRAVISREPASVDARVFLAAALLAQGESQAALACMRRATELEPDRADVWVNLAEILAATGDAEGAIDSYRRGIALRADSTDAWMKLAALLKSLGRYDEAEHCCRAALPHANRRSDVRHLLAMTMFEQGRVEDAIAEIRAALALDPGLAAAGSDLLRLLAYSDAQDPADVFREYRAWWNRHAKHLEDAAPPHANDPDPARKLRVGYVSPYLRKHAVTFFLEPAIEYRDRENYEVYLYADVARKDEYAERLIAHGAVWRSALGKSDEALARMIRDDAIDILVDLSGHTTANRLLAFARRPAPVQVNWLGFPHTTGLSSMNYRITDACCDPPGMTEELNSETLVRLPEIYMAWQPPAAAPEPGPLPALHAGHVTFGSFSSCFKITPTVAALWSRILERVPGSRLMLLAISSQAARQHFSELFAGLGADLARIEFRPRLAFDDYLASFQRADIALDAFPYHGATTTCFSLWMGLPVVALAGATHASRADVSMLANAGVPQLVARTGDEYVDIATGLAVDLPALAKMRAGLRGMMRRSPVTDGRRCARNLDSAFRQMWVAWCEQRA